MENSNKSVMDTSRQNSIKMGKNVITQRVKLLRTFRFSFIDSIWNWTAVNQIITAFTVLKHSFHWGFEIKKRFRWFQTKLLQTASLRLKTWFSTERFLEILNLKKWVSKVLNLNERLFKATNRKKCIFKVSNRTVFKRFESNRTVFIQFKLNYAIQKHQTEQFFNKWFNPCLSSWKVFRLKKSAIINTLRHNFMAQKWLFIPRSLKAYHVSIRVLMFMLQP